jgi:hypothetical protein
MKLKAEEDVLNLEWRQAYLKCLDSDYNVERKRKAFKRFEIYRDKTKKWVIDAMLKEKLSESYIQEIEPRIANVSIARKVVDKKAVIYTAAPKREVETEEDQKKIDELVKELDFNSCMAKANRYLELSRNTVVYAVPQKNVIQSLIAGKDIYDLKVKVLNDHAYDPIIDADNCEVARGFVLSEYIDVPAKLKEEKYYQGQRNKRFKNPPQELESAPGYKKEQRFIWWTNMYHFTTNEKGEILPEYSAEGNINPITMLPIIPLSYDKDGYFFAEGGDDLVDGAIRININMTDMTAIARMQGYGQMVVIGNNIPDVLEVGPHTVLKFVTNQGEDKPDVKFLTSNPPIGDWMSMIEQDVAVYLSMQNLSPRQVATKLDVTQPPSGVSQMIESAEVTFDIEDKQKIFKDSEPLIWEAIRRWIEILFEKKQLSLEFTEIGPFDDSDVQLTFPKNKAVVTESERLDNLQKRKDLGINTTLDLIMLDNPDMTEEQAKAKLDEINNEKQAKMEMFLPPGDPNSPQDQPPQDQNQNVPQPKQLPPTKSAGN